MSAHLSGLTDNFGVKTSDSAANWALCTRSISISSVQDRKFKSNLLCLQSTALQLQWCSAQMGFIDLFHVQIIYIKRTADESNLPWESALLPPCVKLHCIHYKKVSAIYDLTNKSIFAKKTRKQKNTNVQRPVLTWIQLGQPELGGQLHVDISSNAAASNSLKSNWTWDISWAANLYMFLHPSTCII